MTTKKPVRDMSNAEVDDELNKLYKNYNISVEPDGGATANIDLLAANEGRGKAEEAYEATQKQTAAEQKTTAPAKTSKKKKAAVKPKTSAKTETPTKPKEETPEAKETPKPGTLSIPTEVEPPKKKTLREEAEEARNLSPEERLRRQKERGANRFKTLKTLLRTNPKRSEKS